MKSSEIFDNYAKIALEQGLISEAEDKTNPRYDSHDISAIELLYGVKPNSKDEKHIMEQAHPDSVVVAPAHDKVNGLVENELERQDIMVGVARKPTTGNLGAKRYVQAKEELLNEVVKIGFLLDRENQEDLMVLADSCAGRFTKKAFEPTSLMIAGIVVGTLALFKWVTYMENNPESRSLPQDLENAKEELSEAIDDYPALGSVLSPLLGKLDLLGQLAAEAEGYRSEIKATLINLAGAVSPEEKKKILANNASKLFVSGRADKMIKVFDDFRSVSSAVVAQIPLALEELATAKSKYHKDSLFGEVGESIADWWQKYVINSDTEDAGKAIQNVMISAPALAKSLAGMTSSLQNLKAQFNASEESAPELPSITPETTTNRKLPEWA